ncbi:LpqB family beta-propeller domain-containing protein [Streptomyces sp. WMMC897]|uniref:LpqB family beta-propeller domain-containing protein n=1 Tax=Streptomyces sp. WMMC897 TaxID=3014782 RepID=UPI0022B5E5BE|nr:LpqB family beta-propeller domain-containing protein [Streptomyces sp. WMMC897]MCZ7414573.1 LpqB family beta-propeller domain-containing protein [Streptomyces sp. WMMC897]
MRAERSAVALLAVGALLLTGCASMPSSGDVRKIEGSQRSDGEAQVRVFGVPPQDGERPAQIVRGFLEATTSDEAEYETAREYLTKEKAESWDPSAGTVVISGGPEVPPGGVLPDSEESGFTVEVTGSRVAEVDGKHAYTPAEGPYLGLFHLSQEDGEWRIDKLPDGLVLGEADFQRIYRSVNTYYYAGLGPEAGDVPQGKNVLVGDPVYVRRRIDPVTETVRALLNGPTDWLRPVATSAYPTGVRLASGERQLALDDSGELQVSLASGAKGQPLRVERKQCERMAAQLLHTVDHQSSTRVKRVVLENERGDLLCGLRSQEAQRYAPGALNGRAAMQYYLDETSRLVALGDEQRAGVPVDGPFGTGQLAMRHVAVSRGETRAAGVSLDGSSLYVGPLHAPEPFGKPVLTSAGLPKDETAGLTAPSWDGLGDLWVADRAPEKPRLLRIPDGRGTPERVDVPGLGEGRIEALRVAADGIRIVLLVREGEAVTLMLGRVERENDEAGRPRAKVTGLRNVAPQLENVVAASWAGGSRLVVVGKESGGVQQVRVMSTDGSPGTPAKLPNVNEIEGIAASEDEDKPLLADSAEGIVRLPRDGDWQEVTEHGSAPVYPG